MVVIPKLSATLEHDIINSIIDAVGRTIVITYVSSRGVCPVCAGNDPFCSTCGGNTTTDTEATLSLTASVKWKDTDNIIRTPTGQYMEGDCLVRFTVPLEHFETYDAIMRNAVSITVDNRVCIIDSWSFGGSPINRIIATLNVDESTTGQRIGQ